MSLRNDLFKLVGSLLSLKVNLMQTAYASVRLSLEKMTDCHFVLISDTVEQNFTSRN